MKQTTITGPKGTLSFLSDLKESITLYMEEFKCTLSSIQLIKITNI